MTTPPPRPAAYEDLFNLPATLVGEIINGDLYTQPRPTPRHARASIVDPVTRTLEAFKLQDSHWLLMASFVDDAEVTAEPFDAVSFPLAALWAE